MIASGAFTPEELLYQAKNIAPWVLFLECMEERRSNPPPLPEWLTKPSERYVLAIRVSSIGYGAKLTVQENADGTPVFRPYLHLEINLIEYVRAVVHAFNLQQARSSTLFGAELSHIGKLSYRACLCYGR